jgi:hypothetical protein
LEPIGGNLSEVPDLVYRYVLSQWPALSDDVVQLLSKMLVLENERATSQELLILTATLFKGL